MRTLLRSVAFMSATAVASTLLAAPAETETARTLAVDFTNVKGPHDKAFRFCVGAGRASEGLHADDIYADYMQLGSPTWLSPAQVVRLAAQNASVPTLRQSVTVSPGRAFEHQLALHENDVWLVVLSKR